MTEQKTAREIAEEKVYEEETARRRERIAALEKQEEQRQEAERREAEKVQAREKAATEAAELVEGREPLEARITSLVSELSASVEELSELHDKHVGSLQASLDPEWTVPVHDGIRLGNAPLWAQGRTQDVRQTVREYLEGSLPGLYPNAKATKGSLSEVDPLTPVDGDDQAGRPVGEFPWEKLEEAKREISARDAEERERRRAAEAARKIRSLQDRHQEMRNSYARPITLSELIPPEERAEIEDLLNDQEMELVRGIVEA